MNIRTVLREEKIRDLELKTAVTVSPGTSLEKVISRMQEMRFGSATVIEHGKVKGIFTERDLILKIFPNQVDLSRPVQEFMVPNPHVLTPSDSLERAIEVINKYGHRSIPLVDEEKNFVGLVSVRAIIMFLAEHFPTEVFNLPPSPESTDETPEGG